MTTADFGGTFNSPQVILFSADVDRASAFYRRLGFQETFRAPRDGPAIHTDLVLEGYKIGFASITSSQQDHGLDPVTTGQRATITLWTKDATAAYHALSAAGAARLAEPAGARSCAMSRQVGHYRS
jgi:catechol 2,3-dioxygenase-like lactoylglutathione lyase family enzyme